MSEALPKGISVLIPNYNGRALLPEILPTVMLALATTGLPSEIIISDDASTDDSLSYVREHFPTVIILESRQNSGFSLTVNRGIAALRYQLCLLLNSDVKLPEDFFSRQLRYFDNPDCFGVMSRIIGWHSDQIQDGGKFPRFQGLKLKTSGNYILQNPSASDWLPSLYLSGANALMDTQKLRMLGGLNELFSPFYVEDTELSIRAWRMGWTCYYDHSSYCRHLESATIKTGRKKSRIKRIYNRNKMQLHALHLPLLLLIPWHIQTFLEFIISLVIFRGYYIQSWFDFIGRTGQLIQQRRELRVLAKSHNRQIISLPQVVKKIRQQLKAASVTGIR